MRSTDDSDKWVGMVQLLFNYHPYGIVMRGIYKKKASAFPGPIFFVSTTMDYFSIGVEPRPRKGLTVLGRDNPMILSSIYITC